MAKVLRGRTARARQRQPKLTAADKRFNKMDTQYTRALRQLQEAHTYMYKKGHVYKHIVLTAGKKDVGALPTRAEAGR